MLNIDKVIQTTSTEEINQQILRYFDNVVHEKPWGTIDDFMGIIGYYPIDEDDYKRITETVVFEMLGLDHNLTENQNDLPQLLKSFDDLTDLIEVYGADSFSKFSFLLSTYADIRVKALLLLYVFNCKPSQKLNFLYSLIEFYQLSNSWTEQGIRYSRISYKIELLWTAVKECNEQFGNNEDDS